jgi:ABC-type uncharacterized transport system ATPase subunit
LSAAPFVELRNISKYFAKVIANHDVSMQIHKGAAGSAGGKRGWEKHHHEGALRPLQG